MSVVEPVELPTARDCPFHLAPGLRTLREHGPVSRLRYADGQVGWLVTGYALARAVLIDPRFSMRPPCPHPAEDPAKQAAAVRVLEQERMLSGFFMFQDPPEHKRFRRLLAAHYTVRRVNEHRELVERIVADRLAAMERADRPVDLAAMFSSPVSLLTHCALLGVPESDGDLFARAAEVGNDETADAEDVTRAMRDLRECLGAAVERKRRRPADDLVSYVAGYDELSEDEILGVLFLLFLAGHDVTKQALTLSVLTLLAHPEHWSALCADPSLVNAAVEELLRHQTAFQVGTFTRIAREDVELDGAVIAAGERITVSLAAANRDPERFEDPDTLDIGREAGGHLAFGHGVHICLGQHLARLLLQAGLAGLVARYPALRLAVPLEEVPLHTGEAFIAGVRQLPVAW